MVVLLPVPVHFTIEKLEVVLACVYDVVLPSVFVVNTPPVPRQQLGGMRRLVGHPAGRRNHPSRERLEHRRYTARRTGQTGEAPPEVRTF